MMHRSCLGVVLLGICIVFSAEAQATTYELIDIGKPTGCVGNAESRGINSDGVVVGVAGEYSTERGFRWRPTTPPAVDALPPLSGDNLSVAYGVNDAGWIVGMSENPPVSGFERAVVWRPGQAPEYLGGGMSTAHGINCRNEIVGQVNAPWSQARYWWWNGSAWVAEDLPNLPGYSQYATAHDINNADINGRGQIVGQCGSGSVAKVVKWEWSGSAWQVQALSDLPGGDSNGSAWAINDAGIIVGYARKGGQDHGVVWDATGIHDLGIPTGSSASYAWGINSSNQIAGSYTTDGASIACAWEPHWNHVDKKWEWQMVTLNSSIVVGDTSLTLRIASGINDEGWLCGSAEGSDGKWRAVVLIPKAMDGATVIATWGRDQHNSLSGLKGTTYTAIAAGGDQGMALKVDGSIAAWGWNAYGQSNVPNRNDYIALAVGDRFGMALRANGSIDVWGDNTAGQVSNKPTGTGHRAIAAGWWFGLAIKKNGELVAWGQNNQGQCNVPAGNNYVAIAGGSEFAIALKADGSLAAWGCDTQGQVSNVPAGNDFKAIAAGGYHGVALKADGSVVTWGSNFYGEASVPVGNNFKAVACGGHHSLALRSDGTVVGWGYNANGETDTPAGYYTAIAGGVHHSAGVKITTTVNFDVNGDQHVDAIDFDAFSACYNGPTNPPRCQ